jgi:hypothetical protein
MYLRTVKAKGAEGVEFEYIRLVEAYWENGHSKQRVVANLGRKDLLAPHLESLIELLAGGAKKSKSASPSCGEPIQATVAACWGPMLVARSLWREFGLESILDGLAPKSDFVCGRDGKRILARWKQQGRVRVDLNWLQEWYRTLDQLLACKERIEVELFGRSRDLFHLEVEMVFYDLTSTYFEGRGPAGLADFWIQSRWQAAQSAGAGWVSDDQRLAYCPSRLRWQPTLIRKRLRWCSKISGSASGCGG